MSGIMKHGQHIVAFDKHAFGYNDDFRTEDPNPVAEGFNHLSSKDFWERVTRSFFIGRRHELEQDERFAQFLPYVVLWRKGENETKDVFVYQRTKKVGEERLAGNSSIGMGGHVDLRDVAYNPDSVVDVLMTAALAISRELNEELVFTTPTGVDVDFDHMRSHHVIFPKFAGYINDMSNEVGRVHGGCVFTLEVPAGYEAACKEEELVTVGFTPLAAVNVQNMESWSLIVLENIDKVLV
jgi:predicted NUDIX family phosphoesterase